MSVLTLAALDPMVAIVVTVLAGVLGLLVGSFLNVVVWRVPRGESIVTPPSSCPRCGHRIRRRHNIPVISWVALRGRCHDCGQPISARYPLVEVATGLAFAGVTHWGLFGHLPAMLGEGETHIGDDALVISTTLFLYFAAISVALVLIDLDVNRLPNAIVYPSYVVIAAGILAVTVFTGDWGSALRAGICMAALFAAYLAMAIAYPAGMGLGDVKLAGVIGLILGWLGLGPLLVGAFSAFLLGGIFSIALLLMRKAGRKSGIPFGPWMIAGAWVGILWGDTIFDSYLVLVGLK